MSPISDAYRKQWMLPVTIVIVVAVTYYRVLCFPFIQDDWGWFELFQTQKSSALLNFWFDPNRHLFYRPLALTYLLSMQRLFGVNPLPFHLVALAIHALNSILVAKSLEYITGNRLVSGLSGLLFASAVAIHLDPLSWAVGIYDLGGTLFFFLGLLMLLRGHTIVSCAMVYCGSMFKESVVVLPAILIAYALIKGSGNGLYRTVISKRKTLLLLVASFIPILFIKALGVAPTKLPPTHPYYVGLLGGHVVRNIYAYLVWMFQSFLPFGTIHSEFFRFVINDAVLLALIALYLILRRKEGSTLRCMAFLGVWMILALLPTIFLPNHTYRHYATYALPAFLCLVLLFIQQLLSGLRFSDWLTKSTMILGVVIVVLWSSVQANRTYRDGLLSTRFTDGSNELVKKAATVNIVRSGLLNRVPHISGDALFLFGGLDLWAFQKDSGPRVWYSNHAIRVFLLKDARNEGDAICIVNPIESPLDAYSGAKNKILRFDRNITFSFVLADGRLKEVDRSLGSGGLSGFPRP